MAGFVVNKVLDNQTREPTGIVIQIPGDASANEIETALKNDRIDLGTPRVENKSSSGMAQLLLWYNGVPKLHLIAVPGL
ncbi:MAG: hypothetical protein IIA41_09190 [SAR324 cluster bacterium]|nr:hypothetical protein [SAR324 cluster bacterium]